VRLIATLLLPPSPKIDSRRALGEKLAVMVMMAVLLSGSSRIDPRQKGAQVERR
jgi:hypothetical protein